MSSRTALPVLALALLLVASPARAQRADPAAAEALFDDAKKLMAQGRYPEACRKLEESQRLDAGLGTQFHLADCWQHLDRTASAWALFRSVASQAHAIGQVGRERVARDRATALEPYVSKLTIALNAASSLPGVTILRDGGEVGREQWDVPVPVDPGTHLIAALLPGKRPWVTTVDVPAHGRSVTVDVPPPADHPDVPGADRPPPPAEPGTARPTPRPGAPGATIAPGATMQMPTSATETPIVVNRGGPQRVVGSLFIGAGVIGLGVGAFFGAEWIDDRDRSNSHCPGGTCDMAGSRLRDDARSESRYAAGAMALGAASLLAGVVLVVSAPGPQLLMPQTAVRLAPMAGPGVGGLILQADL